MFDLDNIDAVETPENDLEEVVMGLIINSGQARSLAYAALKQAKQGDFEAAKTMMEQSRLALSDAEAFRAFLGQMAAGIRGGKLPDFEKVYLDGLSGTALRDAWIAQVRAMSPRFAAADPKARVPAVPDAGAAV